MPADTPVTMPVEPTVAIAVLLLLHVPPDVVSVNVKLLPEHKEDEPAINPAIGKGLTVMIFLLVTVPQTLLTVYLIVSTPAVTPVTTPVEPTEAEAVFDDDHVPPEIVSVRVTVLPTHKTNGPVIVPAGVHEA